MGILLLNDKQVGVINIDNIIPEGIIRQVVNGKLVMPVNNFTFRLPATVTTISGDNALTKAFSGCTSLTSVDLSSLITILGDLALDNAFQGCTSLTSVDLSNLTMISGNYALFNAFQHCTALTSVDLSNLTIFTGVYALHKAFRDCTSLTSLSFPALNSNSFGGYTDHFNYMLSGVTGCTVHFPSNLQSVIGEWTDVTNGFGGTNTNVLFDLEATT